MRHPNQWQHQRVAKGTGEEALFCMFACIVAHAQAAMHIALIYFVALQHAIVRG